MQELSWFMIYMVFAQLSPYTLCRRNKLSREVLKPPDRSTLGNPVVSVWISKIKGDTNVKEITTDGRQTAFHHQRVLRSASNTTFENSRTTDSTETKTTTVPKLVLPPLKLITLTSVVHRVLPPKPTLRQHTVVPELEINCPGKVYSCSNKCSNMTHYIRYYTRNSKSRTASQKCNCDPACNDIFMDCCGDFETQCDTSSAQYSTDDFYRHKRSWRCETAFEVVAEGCAAKRGIWMVSRCLRHWPDDVTKHKCQAPSSTLSAQSFLSFVPVVGIADLLTYRNQYCALCNNVTRYDYLGLQFEEKTIPPPFYTPEDLMEFIELRGRSFKAFQLKDGQKIRWCEYPTVINTCNDEIKTSENERKECLNGTTGLVKEQGKYYKNKACASCNGEKYACGVSEPKPPSHCVGGTSISRAISLRDYGVSLETKSCAMDHVYDPYLKKCREKYDVSKLAKGVQNKYRVVLSVFKESQNTYFGFQWLSIEKGLAVYFKMNVSQINVEQVNTNLGNSHEIRIIFSVTLTPWQSIIVATDPEFRGTSNETVGLWRLLRFRDAFKLRISGQDFTVYRLRVRQMVCTHRQVYKHGEYTILDDLRIRVNSSGAVYEQSQYYLNSSIPEPLVEVCLKVVRSNCQGSYIKLNSSEYPIFANLTVVYSALVYDFGEYFYDNGTLLICVPFERNYTVSYRKEPKDDTALKLLTWFGFVASIICLVALFITYVVFQELRTLPGKNLMSLTLSLCLAEIFWLCGSMLSGNQTSCTVVAIINHYFFLAFFAASSVIAFHSCLVFGKKIALRRSKSEENRTFLVYSLFVWVIPGVFVLVFALLDHYNVFVTDYGMSDSCWLGTKKSKLFLFIVPLGTILLFNLLLFVVVVVRLYSNQKSSTVALGNDVKKRQSQNVLVCVKLSTLMGFSWLFGLLQVAVETETDVFAYLFVIFVSSQGLFICAAFLFKRSCYQLYSSLLSKNFSSGSASGSDRTHPSNKNSVTNIQDTRL